MQITDKKSFYTLYYVEISNVQSICNMETSAKEKEQRDYKLRGAIKESIKISSASSVWNQKAYLFI